MGNYSFLKIGDEELRWKYDIPSILSFLFDEKDFYKKIQKKSKDKKTRIEEIGYHTNCKKALERLNKLGFNWDLITQVYSLFYEQLKINTDEVIKLDIEKRFNIKDKQKLETRLKIHYNKFPQITKEQELKDFLLFYLPLIKAASGEKSTKLKSIDGRIYNLSPEKNINGENICSDMYLYLFGKGLDLPPWIFNISNLFDEDIYQEYAEIISIIEIKLLLESHSKDTPVILDLSDMIYFEKDLNDFHKESGKRLIEKINLYNKFFNSILNQNELVHNLYLKHELDKQLIQLKLLTKSEKYLKGKALENLIEFIFNKIHGLKVIDKRISNGDEEIDLVIKNNINKTFWSSLSSPCILVECKNWSTKIGSREIRDFETKMRNHQRLVKIGFFVSYLGFTKEALIELKRASRDEFHIAIIDYKDIKEFISSNINILEWIEKIVTKLY